MNDKTKELIQTLETQLSRLYNRLEDNGDLDMCWEAQLELVELKTHLKEKGHA